ncbi:DUF2017 domain-containing protein [Streptomyces sp. NBC_00083]|uniref:DUF2017 domain-containing protein n=1 Tax=Streptomyces sp. NBC_00083 TaxID=2975647 RepID=UPI002255338A|nr:DUF2017 domain-containing protein [Streptomyces sp. NBC_00083]MCX5382189.1 DUF2017 domain-containing protein [Streptomyces sp. NBC_00083]
MAGTVSGFEPLPRGGAAAAFDEVEIAILRSLAVQLLELIGPGDEPDQDADPLAALFAEGPSAPPTDPALARLFPEAYASGESDELRAKSAEFRRFTENDLRARKRADALAVVHGLDALTPKGDGGAVLELTAEDARHWLGALNDLRLTIATRLEITDEDESGELYRLPDDDPRKPMVMAYLWLGVLQETLIETLMA